MSYTATSHQHDHVALVLEILKGAYASGSPWVSGQTLAAKTGTRNLSARIGAIKAQGFKVESRPEGGDAGWYMYRLLSMTPGAPQARSRLVIKLPPGTWTAPQVETFQKACDDLCSRLAKTMPDGQ